MRSALRGVTAAAVATGLVTSSVVLAAPVMADSSTPAKSTLLLAVEHTPNIGRTCVIGVRLSTSAGQVKDKKVVVQKRTAGTKKWSTLKTVTTRRTASAKVELRAVKSVQFRARYGGSATIAADWSNVVKCTPVALKYNSKSATVKPLQKKLKALRIRPSSSSGQFDANTLQAVYAFQKSTGLKRTGVVTASVYTKIMAAKSMKAPSWCSSSTTMCIDISRQAGYLKIKGKRYVIPVSSGGGYYYYAPNSSVREFARTPRGSYSVYYKKPGTTTGPLGTYYWMSFFTGGYGVHGSASVPTYAASHGCVRVPRTIEQWVFKNLPVGATVRVHD